MADSHHQISPVPSSTRRLYRYPQTLADWHKKWKLNRRDHHRPQGLSISSEVGGGWRNTTLDSAPPPGGSSPEPQRRQKEALTHPLYSASVHTGLAGATLTGRVAVLSSVGTVSSLAAGKKATPFHLHFLFPSPTSFSKVRLPQAKRPDPGDAQLAQEKTGCQHRTKGCRG